MLEHWRADAIAVLDRYPAEVERVAVALLLRRELDGETLADLLGDAAVGGVL